MSYTNPYALTSDAAADVEPGDIPQFAPPQVVTYHYSSELLASFWTYRTLTSPSDIQFRKQFIRNITIFAVLVAICCVLLATLTDYWIAVLFMVVSLMLTIFVYRLTRPNAIRLQMTQTVNRLLEESGNDHFLSERILTIDVNGVHQVMAASESHTRWKAFVRIEHDDDYVYLFDSSISAIVVPRAAFATRGQFLGFVRMVEQLWRNAASGVTTVAED